MPAIALRTAPMWERACSRLTMAKSSNRGHGPLPHSDYREQGSPPQVVSVIIASLSTLKKPDFLLS